MADFSQVDDATLARRYRNADAAAQQGDRNARVAARAMAQEIEARRGGSRAVPAETGYEGVVSQTMGGINEGLASVVGAPVQLAQGATNLGIRGVNALFGTEYPYVENAPGSTDWMLEQGGRETPLGPVIPPNTGTHPGMRKVGQFSGAGLGTLATLGAGGLTRAAQQGTGVLSNLARSTLDALTKTPGRTVAADVAGSVAAVPSGQAGGSLAETIAGGLGAENPEDYRPVGEMLGETVGGAVGGGAVAVGSNPGGAVRFALQDPESAARYAAAQRLGIKSTPGLVGNPTAAYMENTAALNPMAGNIVRDPQVEQVRNVSNAYGGVTRDLRAGTGLPEIENKMDAGIRIRDFGNDANARLNQTLNDLTLQEMNALGGRQAAVPVNKIKDKARELAFDLDYEGRVALKNRMAALEADRVTPIDPALDTQLKTKLAKQLSEQEARRATLKALEKKAAAGTATSQELRRARNLRYRLDGYDKNITTTKKQIDANLGVPNAKLDKWRKRLGAATQESGPVDPDVSRALYGAERNQQRIVARDRGTLDEFTTAVKEKELRVGNHPLTEGGDKNFLDKLTKAANGDPKEGKAVFDFLHAQDAGERIVAFKRNVTKEEFATAMGDLLTIMARPMSQDAVNAPMNTDTFSPSVFMTNWHRLPPSTRKAILDSADVEQRIDDIRTLGRALTMRAKHANPSGTAAVAIMAKVLGGTMKNKLLTMATMANNTLLTKAFMSPQVTKIIAREAPDMLQALNAITERSLLKGLAEDTIPEEEPAPSGRLRLELNDPGNQQRNSR